MIFVYWHDFLLFGAHVNSMGIRWGQPSNNIIDKAIAVKVLGTFLGISFDAVLLKTKGISDRSYGGGHIWENKGALPDSQM